MPSGEDYRFLYVMLYNMGKGYHVSTEGETKSLQQLLTDDDYEKLAINFAQVRKYIILSRSVLQKYKDYYEGKKKEITE